MIKNKIPAAWEHLNVNIIHVLHVYKGDICFLFKVTGILAFDLLTQKSIWFIFTQYKLSFYEVWLPYPIYFIPILYRLCMKLIINIAYRYTLESVPETNQYWTVSVKFLAQGQRQAPFLFSAFWSKCIPFIGYKAEIFKCVVWRPLTYPQNPVSKTTVYVLSFVEFNWHSVS